MTPTAPLIRHFPMNHYITPESRAILGLSNTSVYDVATTITAGTHSIVLYGYSTVAQLQEMCDSYEAFLAKSRGAQYAVIIMSVDCCDMFLLGQPDLAQTKALLKAYVQYAHISDADTSFLD